MDERDKEWLDKNNEDRGEGSSKRPSRKGKEPESVPISEDEFELVMAMFEKITHEKAEFLHHVGIHLCDACTLYLFPSIELPRCPAVLSL